MPRRHASWFALAAAVALAVVGVVTLAGSVKGAQSAASSALLQPQMASAALVGAESALSSLTPALEIPTTATTNAPAIAPVPASPARARKASSALATASAATRSPDVVAPVRAPAAIDEFGGQL